VLLEKKIQKMHEGGGEAMTLHRRPPRATLVVALLLLLLLAPTESANAVDMPDASSLLPACTSALSVCRMCDCGALETSLIECWSATPAQFELQRLVDDAQSRLADARVFEANTNASLSACEAQLARCARVRDDYAACTRDLDDAHKRAEGIAEATTRAVAALEARLRDCTQQSQAGQLTCAADLSAALASVADLKRAIATCESGASKHASETRSVLGTAVASHKACETRAAEMTAALTEARAALEACASRTDKTDLAVCDDACVTLREAVALANDRVHKSQAERDACEQRLANAAKPVAARDRTSDDDDDFQCAERVSALASRFKAAAEDATAHEHARRDLAFAVEQLRIELAHARGVSLAALAWERGNAAVGYFVHDVAIPLGKAALEATRVGAMEAWDAARRLAAHGSVEAQALAAESYAAMRRAAADGAEKAEASVRWAWREASHAAGVAHERGRWLMGEAGTRANAMAKSAITAWEKEIAPRVHAAVQDARVVAEGLAASARKRFGGATDAALRDDFVANVLVYVVPAFAAALVFAWVSKRASVRLLQFMIAAPSAAPKKPSVAAAVAATSPGSSASSVEAASNGGASAAAGEEDALTSIASSEIRAVLKDLAGMDDDAAAELEQRWDENEDVSDD